MGKQLKSKMRSVSVGFPMKLVPKDVTYGLDITNWTCLWFEIMRFLDAFGSYIPPFLKSETNRFGGSSDGLFSKESSAATIRSSIISCAEVGRVVENPCLGERRSAVKYFGKATTWFILWENKQITLKKPRIHILGANVHNNQQTNKKTTNKQQTNKKTTNNQQQPTTWSRRLA